MILAVADLRIAPGRAAEFDLALQQGLTEGFRGGPLFAEWRALGGPFFAARPVVEHFTLLAKSG